MGKDERYEIPIYNYSAEERWACPDCYRPVSSPKRGRDGRCRQCRSEVIYGY